VKHDDSVDEHLDGLLAALVDIEKTTSIPINPNFVTWRGMLTKIMCLPFDSRDGFEMNAIRYKDTIFIEENHRYKLRTKGGTKPNLRQELMSYWGYKFETLATLPTIWDECSRDTIESRTTEIVNNKAQFCSIVKTAFADISLVLGGEVDAVWDAKSGSPEDSSNYVELKTTKQLSTLRDEAAFERKLLRFWSQSFLLGVQKIIVGERNNDGILLRVREMDTQSIPNIAKTSRRNLWDGKFSIDFTTAFLEWLRDTVKEGSVWRIRHAENSHDVDLFKVDEPSFLSKDFLEWRSTEHSSQ